MLMFSSEQRSKVLQTLCADPNVDVTVNQTARCDSPQYAEPSLHGRQQLNSCVCDVQLV
jgi:hypothetical protein